MAEADCEQKFVTQIIYRKGDHEYVAGYIASFGQAPKPWKNYKWSKDGEKWSTKWYGYNAAIRKLLVARGHHKYDTIHVIPVAEIQKDLWK